MLSLLLKLLVILKKTYAYNYICCQSAPLIHKQARRRDVEVMGSAVCLWHELENLWNMSTVKGKHWVSGGDVWKTCCICHHPFRAMKTRTVKVVTWGNNVTSSFRALVLNLILLQNFHLACMGYSSNGLPVSRFLIITRYVVCDHKVLLDLITLLSRPTLFSVPEIGSCILMWDEVLFCMFCHLKHLLVYTFLKVSHAHQGFMCFGQI